MRGAGAATIRWAKTGDSLLIVLRHIARRQRPLIRIPFRVHNTLSVLLALPQPTFHIVRRRYESIRRSSTSAQMRLFTLSAIRSPSQLVNELTVCVTGSNARGVERQPTQSLAGLILARNLIMELLASSGNSPAALPRRSDPHSISPFSNLCRDQNTLEICMVRVIECIQYSTTRVQRSTSYHRKNSQVPDWLVYVLGPNKEE